MIYKNKGSALTDYVFPTAIIGAALGLTLYFMVDNNSILNYIKASSNYYQKGNELILNSSQTTLIPGFLGGKTDKPVMQCNNVNMCVIDFGEFVLSGIPESISDATTSTRGGEQTSNYANLLLQIVTSLQQNGGDSALTEYLKKLANNAQKMAIVEKQGDNFALSLNSLEKSFINESKAPEENIQEKLASIDKANLKPEDYNLLLASQRYMLDKGLIGSEDMQNFAKITLSIKQDYPNLKSWQTDFLNQILSLGDTKAKSEISEFSESSESNKSIELASDSYDVESFAEGVEEFLTSNPGAQSYIDEIVSKNSVPEIAAESEGVEEAQLSTLSTSFLGNYNQYIIAIKDSSNVTNVIHSDSKETDPGYIFKNLVDNPPANIPDYIAKIVNQIGGEVTKIGNAVSIENIVIDTKAGISSQQFVISPDANIETKIAESILKNFQ